MYTFNRSHYSIRDSFLVVDGIENGFMINTIRRQGVTVLFEVKMQEKTEAFFSPWELTLRTENSEVKVCLYGKDGAYIKGRGKGLLFESVNSNGYDFTVTQDNKVMICHTSRYAYEWFSPKKGSLKVESEREKGCVRNRYTNIRVLPDGNGEFEFTFEGFVSEGDPQLARKDYEACVREVKDEYSAWEKKFPIGSGYDKECAYVLWSNLLPKGGNYDTEAIVMSKGGMYSVWSWDNLFNAWVLADVDPQMAYDQFTLLLKHMNGEGRVPDSIGEGDICWQFVKPPIYGWIYERMQRKDPIFSRREFLLPVYEWVKKNTEWWLTRRGETPCYYHGNDSGADNSTVFDHSEHIETGELLALLSLQCRFLADTAKVLEIFGEERYYTDSAERLEKKAIGEYWDGRLFVRCADDKKATYTQSLLPLRIVVLGKRLPKEIAEYIARELETEFLNVGGCASEAYRSPEFDRDGYWRGTVWAPDQLMLCEGLKEIGYTELAEKIAKRYTDSLERSGFYENLDALTGDGLRCRAYSWSVNAYMLLK